jgi:hypothetical protein
MDTLATEKSNLAPVVTNLFNLNLCIELFQFSEWWRMIESYIKENWKILRRCRKVLKIFYCRTKQRFEVLDPDEEVCDFNVGRLV